MEQAEKLEFLDMQFKSGEPALHCTLSIKRSESMKSN